MYNHGVDGIKGMSDMAILELTVQGEYFGQQCINRFHYVASGTPAAVSLSFGLISATGFMAAGIISGDFAPNTLARGVQNIVHNQFQFVAAYARDLYSLTDFYESPYPVRPVGELAGDAGSPALAYAFRSNRVRTDVRRGMKRFAGTSEQHMDSGGVVTSALLGEMSATAAKMSATITYDDDGNTLTYIPAVLGFEEYTTPGGKRAYRPYATAAAQLDHTAQGIVWSPYTTVRTQRSRQYGHGV